MSSEIVPETSADDSTDKIPVDSKLRKLARGAKSKFDSVPQGWGQRRSPDDRVEQSPQEVSDSVDSKQESSD